MEELVRSYLQSYIKLGFKVFPTHGIDSGKCTCGNLRCDRAGKHPATQHGFKNATDDFSKLCQFWQLNACYNIGIQTGIDSGITILDFDFRNDGQTTFKELSHRFPELLEVASRVTTGGGFHLYLNTGTAVIKSRPLIQGLDIKSKGGYIIAPPSTHKTGLKYTWDLDFEKINRELIHVPSTKLIEFLNSENNNRDVGKTVEGSRNNTLFSYGLALASKGLTQNDLKETIQAFNKSQCTPPLEEKEVDAIFNSILKYSNNKKQNAPYSREDSHIWTSPIPISEKTLTSENIDLELLPEPLKNFCRDKSIELEVPSELIVVPVLVALSSVVLRRMALKPYKNSDYIIVPNLWGLTIAPPGFKKSPAARAAFAPLFEKEKQDYEKYRLQHLANQNEIECNISIIENLKKKISSSKTNDFEKEKIQSQILNLKEKNESIKIAPKRLVVMDGTIEKISILLTSQKYGLALYQDEFLGFLKTLEKKGNEGARQFYLTSFSGLDNHIVDRVTRAQSPVYGLCLSLFGTTQPDMFREYFKQTLNSGAGDGFLQRVQVMVFPEFIHIDTPENFDGSLETTKRYQEHLLDILTLLEDKDLGDERTSIEASDNLIKINFTKAAASIFKDHIKKINTRIRSGSFSKESYASHLAKYDKLIGSLAILLEISESALSGDVPKVVTENSLFKAIKLSQWLESHAQKIYNFSDYASGKKAKAILDHYINGDIPQKVSLREIYRNNWKWLKTKEEVEDGIDLLITHGYVIRIKMPPGTYGGRVSEKIEFNPLIVRKKEVSHESH